MTPLTPVELAHVPPFRLGNVEVHPATRQIVRDGRSETVEPRVMQVIVALVEARGGILTRDELIMRCWEGRVVGDNAIRRAVSQVRAIAAEMANGAFELETITKVGYRLVVHEGAPITGDDDPPEYGLPASAPLAALPPAPPTGVDRRLLLGGGLAVAAAAAVGAYAWMQRRPEDVAELLRRGEIAMRHGMPEQSRQGLAFYRLAVEKAPDDADAWGGLALAYHNMLSWSGPPESAGFARQGRSAARRALALDPGNADGHAALAVIDPFFQRWATAERDLSRLAERFPDHWLIRTQRAALCYETGRWREGIGHSERVLKTDAFLPMAQLLWTRGLWSDGRLHEAENALKSALERWPGHWPLWDNLVTFYMFTGRAEAAVALARNPDLQPAPMAPGAIEKRIALVDYAATRDPAERERLLALYLAEARAGLNIPNLIPVFALLNAADQLFDLLAGYYLGRGPYRVARPDGSARHTNALFAPPFARFRRDPRFASLLEEIGLEDFWRQSGSRPDYRR